MTWVKRGKDFWSSPDGRFDKLKVVTPRRVTKNFSTRDNNRYHPQPTVREVVKEGETYFTMYDWVLGNAMRFREEKDAEAWVKDQQKKDAPALTPGRTPA